MEWVGHKLRFYTKLATPPMQCNEQSKVINHQFNHRQKKKNREERKVRKKSREFYVYLFCHFILWLKIVAEDDQAGLSYLRRRTRRTDRQTDTRKPAFA